MITARWYYYTHRNGKADQQERSAASRTLLPEIVGLFLSYNSCSN
ncbi:hypothetical protein AB395_00003388 [Sinorhizobium fredii CCBAU 45436]|nr:hypothetical protein AB395_00003388 [Sinorhizobium fredii CCBAU 45436]